MCMYAGRMLGKPWAAGMRQGCRQVRVQLLHVSQAVLHGEAQPAACPQAAAPGGQQTGRLLRASKQVSTISP